MSFPDESTHADTHDVIQPALLEYTPLAMLLAQVEAANLHLAMSPPPVAPLNAPVRKRTTIAAIASTAAMMIKYSNAPCAFLINIPPYVIFLIRKRGYKKVSL